MKKLFAILPILLLTSCDIVETTRYFNVEYQYDFDSHYYLVHYDNDKEKKIQDTNFHYVYVDNYPCCNGNCSTLATNEFVITHYKMSAENAYKYNLYVYKLNK